MSADERNEERLQLIKKIAFWGISAIVVIALFTYMIATSKTQEEINTETCTSLEQQIADGQKYIVVTSYELEAFTDLVNMCIDKGYEAQGGLTYLTIRERSIGYSQALVRSENSR